MAVVLAIPFAVAACGGGGSSNSNSDPTSENYDPAHTTLKDAGLEVCGDANTQVPQNLSSGSGFQNSRAFFVASDCMGKETSPDTAMVFQYDSKQSVDAAFAKVQTALPNSSSEKYWTADPRHDRAEPHSEPLGDRPGAPEDVPGHHVVAAKTDQ